METIKSYTDLEQSKELAKILHVDSADMYYQTVLPRSKKLHHVPNIGSPIESLEWYNKGYTITGKKAIELDEYCVPCWSLAALLDVIPHTITTNKKELELCIAKEFIGYHLFYEDSGILCVFTASHDNLVDACYEMIQKIHEQNLL